MGGEETGVVWMGGMEVGGRPRVGARREGSNRNGCEETCRGREWFREGIGNERDGHEGRVGEGSEETEGVGDDTWRKG